MAIKMDIITLLQFFAEGGEGGDSGSAASTGDTPADAGQDFASALRARGVPEGKIRKDRAYKLPAAKPAPQPQQDAAAEPKETPTVEAAPPKKLSFDEMLDSDPDYKAEYERRNKETASSVRKKLAEVTNQNKEMAPIIELMARRYNMDMESPNLGELAKTMENDKWFYEDDAFAKGIPVEDFMSQDIKARADARAQREQTESIREQKEREWAQRVSQQVAALREKVPDFDLRKEMENPRFAAMLHPSLPFTVEDAFYLVNRDKIAAAQKEAVAKAVKEQISANIRAGQARPTEAGAGAQARTVSPVQPAAYDRKHSEAVKAAVLEAKAQGKKVYPGQI